jgi:hypothetical protein
LAFVLGSLSKDALRVTWNCISAHGRFVQIGSQNVSENTTLNLAPFSRNATFHSVDIDFDIRHSVALASSTLLSCQPRVVKSPLSVLTSNNFVAEGLKSRYILAILL